MDDLKERFRHIVELKREEVGKSEENVKQKIVVPLLECLGHHRTLLDFEYGTGGRRIDIFIKDLPKDCKVVIDTKNYDEDLNNHLQQIGLYAFQEGAILALIINGEEIRIYDPFFRGYSFKDSLLYSLKRIELMDDSSIEIIRSLLSRESLKSRSVKEFIIKREQEITEAYSKIEEVKDRFEKKKAELLDKKEELNRRLYGIQGDIRGLTEQITEMDSERDTEIGKVLESIQLPLEITYKEPSPLSGQEIGGGGAVDKHPERIEIVLKKVHTPITYGLIPLRRECRSFFPGYKVKFVLETDIGEIETQVTSNKGETRIGDPEKGSYIQGGLKPWYNRHGELREGNKLIIEAIEPKKRYRLSISK